MKANGFTILELIIAMGIFSIISVASVWLVFLNMSLRDLSSASVKTEEALRIFNHSIQQAVQNASAIAFENNTLLLKSPTDCWSFNYDSFQKKLKYDHLKQTECNPNPNPTTLFFADSNTVDNLVFTVSPLSTGGKQITATGSLSTILPFNSYIQPFTFTVISLID